MKAAAADLDFERAASLRDRVRKLRSLLPGAPAGGGRRTRDSSNGSRTRCSKSRNTSSCASRSPAAW